MILCVAGVGRVVGDVCDADVGEDLWVLAVRAFGVCGICLDVRVVASSEKRFVVCSGSVLREIGTCAC